MDGWDGGWRKGQVLIEDLKMLRGGWWEYWLMDRKDVEWREEDSLADG